MEDLQVRNRLADLLEATSREDYLDLDKLREFEELSETLPHEDLLDEAFNELIEYDQIWNQRTLLGKRLEPPADELSEIRWNLQLLARAIRENFPEFKSLEQLRDHFSRT